MQQIRVAVEKAREVSPQRNFRQSFEIQVNFRELDMRRPEDRVDMKVRLPNGAGDRKVLIFASGDLALRSRRGGSDEVIEPDELNTMAGDKKLAKSKLKPYDVFVAEASLMPTVGRVAGPILGPKGKMPTPVPPQAPIDEILERERSNIILRSRDRMFVHGIIGKEDMSDEEISENIESIINALDRALERGFRNIKSIYVKTSMGDSVKLY
jgi:large subunit ribosomal protein L1